LDITVIANIILVTLAPKVALAFQIFSTISSVLFNLLWRLLFYKMNGPMTNLWPVLLILINGPIISLSMLANKPTTGATVIYIDRPIMYLKKMGANAIKWAYLGCYTYLFKIFLFYL
jgi:hypothetical protein